MPANSELCERPRSAHALAHNYPPPTSSPNLPSALPYPSVRAATIPPGVLNHPTPLTTHAHDPPMSLSLSYPPSGLGGDESVYDGAGDKAGSCAAGSVVDVSVREVLRTPSPTPQERRVLERKTQVIGDVKPYLRPRRYANRRGVFTLAAITCGILFIVLFLVYQQHIVRWMRPFADWMHDTPGGWVIPIAIMFVLSFPPLFGHEVIAILCGDVWGIWIGFGIVAAGTLLGELGNFYAFKWCCTARGKKMEEKRLTYALYAQVVREGGLVVPTIMRLTFIPGHLLTAIFSTCGMSLWGFFVSATLSLPKQLATTYIGVAQSTNGNSPKTSGIKAVVVLATVAMTYVAMRYVNRKIDAVKEKVVYARRKARQARMLQAAALGLPEAQPANLEDGSGRDDDLGPEELTYRDPSSSSQTLPQKPHVSARDANPVVVHMPRPQRAASRVSLPAQTHRPTRSGGSSPWMKGVSRLKVFGSRRKRAGSGSGSGGVDEGAEAEVIELDVGGHEGALRARRHAEIHDVAEGRAGAQLARTVTHGGSEKGALATDPGT
ncbi:hypothetical protein OH77DRAFT_1431025 [Trametes cingulata]|nr:hypothetical protein OH77DRAFT_1431025 [Trametes cingulata]